MRYRDGYRESTADDPGAVYKVSMDMRAIAYFPPGHRLRVQFRAAIFRASSAT